MTNPIDSPRVALVTGASRGIGAAIAKHLVAEGYLVYGTATTVEGARKISGYHDQGRVTGLVCDVANLEDIQALRERIPQKLGILVNNAGITRDNLLMRLSEEEWDTVLDVNLRSVYRLCKLFIRDMIKLRWGRIINISSVVANSGNPGQCNYSASKSGLIGFGKSLALELASRNITVNCVAPGFIETDMTRDLDEKTSQAMLSKIPLQRFGRADEVAATVVFLASDAAGYITGESIDVNGGLHID